MSEETVSEAAVPDGSESSEGRAARAPRATYRVQLTPDFGFAEVAALGDYLAGLGVSHVYLSPILQAVPASRHGYDVTDHSRIRAEFGGAGGFRAMARHLADRGIGIVADLVPNHMTVAPPESANAAFWSVLKDGEASPYSHWFDVEYRDGKIDLPVLSDTNEPHVDGDVLRYGDHVFPLPADHYRLVRFTDPPGYRRFFDVSSLIGLRAEDERVFEATHAVMLDLVAEGLVHGLRVDHPDGLTDPRGYFERLRRRSGGVWTVAEKILIGDERLPADWPCDGTTGYDALNRVLRLFVDPAGEKPLTDLFVRRTHASADYPTIVADSKRQVIAEFLRGETDRLTGALARALGADPARLRGAVVELLVAMPVYRAYAVPGEPVPAHSREIVEEAARVAAERADPETVAAVAGQVLDGPAEVVVRFQQTCGPVMAKGVEDTALYRYYPLSCLNEVGGEPGEFCLEVEEFHRFCQSMTPTSMTTLSTHDTKRSEDVRARLAVLSEMPHEWAEAVAGWAERVWCDPALDYLAWQNLMAAWPISVERFTDYLLKAAREAKTSISWATPDARYERSLRDFAARAIGECGPSVAAFATRVDRYAQINSLGQKVVQLLMPGVPDVYQGSEFTDFSLVDPDNRRPVDFTARAVAMAAGPDLITWDGAKLQVTVSALAARRRLAAGAAHTPLRAEGEAAEHAVAFARGGDVVAVATRLPVRLANRGGWGATTLTLPPGDWRDLLTGQAHTGRIPMAHLLARCPVAVLERDVRSMGA
ncbi:malto-oligosyltrehalose synthase [Sinosporangium siamense]|uniref:Malto-oligosyltrehalose synthase n=1 Tax=Sinosporangium siamense TaxID=1367973 RepID=A0A919RCN9_9ACTN|nr:malto-oligosyltrehalose synthase [Sinosporangium siamense]GII91223.1 malto-oligosyltrehalose synthase [Sinosporangium siamense]